MDYALKYRLFPDESQREHLDWVRDTVRQLYNHALHRFNRLPESAGTVKQRVTQVRDEIPDLKDWWTDLTNIYSTVLQQAVEQIATNIQNLGKLKQKGFDVGSLNWKAPHEYRSFTYRQRGFELDNNSGPTGRGTLVLKKINGETLDVPLRLHRDIPDDTDIKHVTVKKDKTGAWYACLSVEREMPEKPDPGGIDVEDTIGLDLGILSFVHDSDGRAIGRLDLSDDRERLEGEQRNLSRKEHGSSNWEDQRQVVAEVHKEMRRKKLDFKHKLAFAYTTVYDAVFVENLNVKSMLEGPRNGRNTHEVGWRDFITILKHHGNKHGCHVREVNPEDTTQACNRCGIKTEKPLWIREHSCPSCGFETDRDHNAALNIWERGLRKLGVVHSEAPTSSESQRDSDGLRKSFHDFRTPAETATAVEQTHRGSVSASRVRQTTSGGLSDSESLTTSWKQEAPASRKPSQTAE